MKNADRMYNAEIKLRYIQEKESDTVLPTNHLYNIFNKSASFEERLEKDIFNFTYNEILDMYKTLNYMSIDTLYVLNSSYSQYVNWCLNENLVRDCQNHFLEFNREILLTCVNRIAFEKRIIPRKEILNWCSQLPNPSDCFVILCVFEGISGKEYREIWEMRPEDIDWEKHIIHLCTDRDIEVSEELLEYARQAIEEPLMYAMTNNMEKTTPLVDIGTVLKVAPNTKDNVSSYQKGRRVLNKFIRALSFVGVSNYIKPKVIEDSGIIYYINRICDENGLTGYQFLFTPSWLKMANTQFNKNIVRSSFYTKFKDYLR